MKNGLEARGQQKYKSSRQPIPPGPIADDRLQPRRWGRSQGWGQNTGLGPSRSRDLVYREEAVGKDIRLRRLAVVFSAFTARRETRPARRTGTPLVVSYVPYARPR